MATLADVVLKHLKARGRILEAFEFMPEVAKELEECNLAMEMVEDDCTLDTPCEVDAPASDEA